MEEEDEVGKDEDRTKEKDGGGRRGWRNTNNTIAVFISIMQCRYCVDNINNYCKININNMDTISYLDILSNIHTHIMSYPSKHTLESV